MKKFIIFAVMFTSAVLCLAQAVDQTKAMQRASRYFNEHVRPAGLRSTADAEPAAVTPWMAGDTTCMYAVQIDGGGWVLVSADERTTASVLAYSENGTFDTNDMPDGMKWLLGDYADQILRVKRDTAIVTSVATPGLRSNQPSNPGTGSAIYTPGEWLLNLKGEGEILWNQSRYPSQKKNFELEGDSCSRAYNYFCPTFGLRNTKIGCNCSKAPAGCGPVAMGQIMRYWKWPNWAVVTEQDNARIKFYEWDFMPVQVDMNTSVEDAQRVSSLLRDLGIVAKTEYGPEDSGTPLDDLQRTLLWYSYHVKREKVSNDVSGTIRNEICEGRPVIFVGWTNDDGHYFVIDGYGNEAGQMDFFHINWGWGPRNNPKTDRTYCLLNKLCPYIEITPEETFSRGQEIFYQIYPECQQQGAHSTISGEVSTSTPVSASNKIEADCIVNSGELFLQSNEVELKSGFEVKPGASLYVTTPAYQYCQTKGPGRTK